MDYRCVVRSGLAAFFLFCLPFALVACGGGGNNTVPPAVTSVSVTGIDSTTPFVVGQARALRLTAAFVDGSTKDVPVSDVTWSSSDETIATVDASGKVNAVASGNATITFTYQKVSGTDDVTVVVRKLTAIDLTADKTSVPTGASIQITAHGTFNDQTTAVLSASDGVTFASSNPATAKLSPSPFGELQTLMPGSVTITAQSADGIKGTVTITVGAAQLVQIMVTPAQTTTSAGIPLQLTAAGNYSDSSTQDITASVTWNVTGIANAAVSADGKLTAPTAGTAMVTATLDGVTSSPVDITVNSGVLVAVKIMGGNTSIAKGLTGAAMLNGTFSDGTQQAVTADSWTSSDPSVLTVDTNGNLKAIGVGSATLTGARQGFSDSLEYTVTPTVVTKVDVTLAIAQVPTGLTTQASAQATYSDATTADLTSQVVWASSDNRIVTVDASGKVTGVAKGSADISATYKSAIGMVTLTVTGATLQGVQLKAADLAGGQISRAKGLTEQVSLVGSFSDGSTATLDNSEVSWSIANPSIASVTPNGLVTFLKVGTTILTGTSDSYASSAQLTTTAAIPVSLQINGPSSVPAGTTANYTATGMYSDATTADVIPAASWSSSAPSSAIILSGGSTPGLLRATEAGNVTITADGTLNGAALSSTKQIAITPATLTIQQDTSSGFGNPTWVKCGMLGSGEGQFPGCLVSTTKTLQQTPVPPWFTVDRFRLIASGRDWTSSADVAVFGGASMRVINVSTGQPLQNSFVIPAGGTLEIAVQIQSTAGVQETPQFSVNSIDNSGTGENAITEFITITTN